MTTPVGISFECRGGPREPLHRPAEATAGRPRPSASPEELACLLLPIVRRMIRTGRGPTALRRWGVARPDLAEPSAVADRTARTLAANLVQLLLDSPDPQRDTVRQ